MISRLYKRLKKWSLSPEEYAKTIGVQIGDGCFISTKNFSSEPYLIKIGNNVRIASGVSFFTHGGIWPFRKIYKEISQHDYFGKINIGNNVYIGEDAKILPGVTIEDNCIIGAATIVTKSIKQGSIVAGNPARIVGKTEDLVKRVSEKSFLVKGISEKKKQEILLHSPNEMFFQKDFM